MESLKELYKIGFGPSSSHTMGPAKASEYFLNKYPDMEKYEVKLFGSLSLTGRGHLTDQIIKRVFGEKRLDVKFEALNQEIIHPNTMEFVGYKNNEIFKETILSIGGGSIEVVGEKPLKQQDIYPFNSFEEIKNYMIENNMDIKEFLIHFEGEEIIEYLKKCWKKMVKSVENGLKNEGFLPGKLNVKRKAKEIYENVVQEDIKEVNERRLIAAYAYAVSEENASGGEIVTAPTCGSSGVVPSILYYFQKKKGYSDEKIALALGFGGLIGNLIKTNASISGAECGCQAEIGTACAIAGVAISYLFGLSIEEIEHTAEMAIEHSLGLTCDPVDGYVQIPCIERNAIFALRALDCSNMAVYVSSSRKVSLDTIIETMRQTGIDISEKYRETSIGGLAKTYERK